MNVVNDWEALIIDLQKRVQNGEESCRPLLEKAEGELKQAREKQVGRDRNRDGH